MKKNKEITSRNYDFAKWYTDIVIKAKLVDYSSIKGCLVFRPYGYAIWENIQKILDQKFKETGHVNVYMPLFISESLLNKEKDHIEGFAPELAWITHGGDEKLSERLCVRPTSETLFCEYYAKEISSYRDLPKLYNQWCSVVRWEKTTRPFLRTREFLWQEGHTAHENKEEALEETLRMLNVYDDFINKSLMIPTIKGEKTTKEKFAGAVKTYTIESLMYNGIALQSATSHYFGDNFARVFDITYSDRFNQLKYVHQTSWGLSTRIIGAIIMVHGDDNGLVLPPDIAPYKVVIVPIGEDLTIIEEAKSLENKLKESKISVLLDLSDKTPGFKFAEYEMKGVPLRIEIGPKDIAKQQYVVVRRDDGSKRTIIKTNIIKEINDLLLIISNNMYQQALKRREALTCEVNKIADIKKIPKEKIGFIKAPWCGSLLCEEKVKEETGLSARCIPLDQPILDSKVECLSCSKKAQKLIYWGLQY